MSSAAPPPRSACPITYALEIFGDRWTLIVLREILLKSRSRYGEILACEESIATNILADRLKRLEARGLIRRGRDANDRRHTVYKPTEQAVALIPMLVEMVAWSFRHGATAKEGPGFLARFETDRDALIAELQAQVRSEAGLEETS